MKMLFFRNYYFIENLQLKIKSSKDKRKKKRNCRLRERKKQNVRFSVVFFWHLKRLSVRLLRYMAKKHSGFYSKKSFTL